MSERVSDPERWRSEDAIYFYGRGTPFSMFRAVPGLKVPAA